MTARVSFDFTGTQALITGGTSGIGHATATLFRDAQQKMLSRDELVRAITSCTLCGAQDREKSTRRLRRGYGAAGRGRQVVDQPL